MVLAESAESSTTGTEHYFEDPYTTNAPRPKQSQQAKNAAAKPSQEDLRILVQTHADEEGVSAGPPRKDPFQIRARLGKAFGLSLAKVPEVRVTRKGDANPDD